MKLNINKTKFEKVADIKVPDIFYRRLKTGIDVVDSAFGQGFLPSSTVVLSGEPGTGKTTFLLQILESLSIRKYNVGYVSGEECMELLKVNCDRIGVKNIMACNETNIDTILKHALAHHIFEEASFPCNGRSVYSIGKMGDKAASRTVIE